MTTAGIIVQIQQQHRHNRCIRPARASKKLALPTSQHEMKQQQVCGFYEISNAISQDAPQASCCTRPRHEAPPYPSQAPEQWQLRLPVTPVRAHHSTGTRLPADQSSRCVCGDCFHKNRVCKTELYLRCISLLLRMDHHHVTHGSSCAAP